MPLILPVTVVCNTSDQDLADNIKANSADNSREWLEQARPHDGVAIMCGSGPSLIDSLDRIFELQAEGGHVFALNGAARFLDGHGIFPDYQAILDARLETSQLIGPAAEHLFASQVHPRCFEIKPAAKLWHLQIEDIESFFPVQRLKDAGYALIGGAASIGNTALCLAYAMGYRTFHLFGYDSSHRGGESHAFHQALNDGEPCAKVTFNGKDYFCSLTMKLQAEKFQETGRLLEHAGCTIHVHGIGLLPDMWSAPVEDLSEREKYERMWRIPGYRSVSPGEDCAATFIEVAHPSGRVIDFGCGTGRAGLAFLAAGLEPILVDFADNCRDPEAVHLPFLQHDLSDPLSIRAPFGFCADVMEHIPPSQVDAVITNIMQSCQIVFFQISTVPDRMGAAINQVLHLSVHPHDWWLAQFERLGFVVTHQSAGDISSQFLVTRKP